MTDCPFCNYGGPNEILMQGTGWYVIEPLNPVVPGHLLVIPRTHVPSFGWSQSLDATVMKVASCIIEEKGGEWNVITSVGPNATQTVKHLHVHLVPRHEGDGLLLPWSHVQDH